MYNRITMKTRPDIYKYAIQLSVNGKPVFVVLKDTFIVTSAFIGKGSVSYTELDNLVDILHAYQCNAEKYL